MDFERAIIKLCLYDFPLDVLAKLLREGEKDKFCELIPDILKWVESDFTLSEWKKFKDLVKKKWMTETLRGKEFVGSELAKVFLLLNRFSCNVLIPGVTPTIKFEHLLRWNSLTKFIGEDALTCSLLAENDLEEGYDRKNFAWGDVLEHNDKDVNQILDEGLSDIHAHYFATTDIANSNWIVLMNRISIDKKLEPAQEVEFGKPDCDQPISFDDFFTVAAFIRAQLCQHLYFGTPFEKDKVNAMLKSPIRCKEAVSETRSLIAAMLKKTRYNADGKLVDYAIVTPELAGSDPDSPYLFISGERLMLYKFFYKYYGNDNEAVSIAPYLFLYLLVKNKVRREMVQTNRLNGFENFGIYQDNKSFFLDPNPNIDIDDTVNRYIVQSAIGKDAKNNFEARTTTKKIKHLNDIYPRLGKAIFTNNNIVKDPLSDHLRLVVHLIKRKETNREKIKREIEKILQASAEIETYNSHYSDKLLSVVGIDAASSELVCRPELFAPAFRWARNSGLGNITFHTGEDFYDLVDGLRSIDETVTFMEYRCGDRLGHALALGVNPHTYYSNRHNHVVTTKQYMLDNLVWLKYRSKKYNLQLAADTDMFIEQTANQLLIEIGYGEDTSLYHYWLSMLLRGDDMQEDSGLTSYAQASKCKSPECEQARMSKKANTLYAQYLYKKFKVKGEQPDTFEYPKSIADDVFNIQEAMMDELERNGVCIECNPSSNLSIGPFKKYEDLPITRFYNVKEPRKHQLKISINTDDRGVFATSLRNEYSLVALSLLKQQDESNTPLYTREEVLRYLKTIAQNGNNYRFAPTEVKSI